MLEAVGGVERAMPSNGCPQKDKDNPWKERGCPDEEPAGRKWCPRRKGAEDGYSEKECVEDEGLREPLRQKNSKKS